MTELPQPTTRTEPLAFSNNWNRAKLDCTCFTTLRLSGRYEIGDRMPVFLGPTQIGMGEIIGKKRLASIDDINDWVAYLDTGYSADECRAILKKMYPKITLWATQPIYYYLVRIAQKSRVAPLKTLPND